MSDRTVHRLASLTARIAIASTALAVTGIATLIATGGFWA